MPSSVIGAVLSAAQIVDVLGPGAATTPAESGRLLDASGIDFVILRPDSPADAPAVRFDPTIAATVLARHTRSVGLVVAIAPLRDHPYNLARRVASLDHLSGGRAGWLVLPDDPAAPHGSLWAEASTADVLADAVTVARALWESWPADSIIGDAQTGTFADSSRISYVDHAGVHQVSGPLNVPEPPQSKVPIFAETALVPHADVYLDADQVTLVSRPGPAETAIRAAAEHVRPGSEPAPGTTLRRRLGLPAPHSVLRAPLRSAFPAA